MFKKRWKKMLFWTLSVIVVLGIGGLFAADYAVDKLMNSMAESFDLESEEKAVGQIDGLATPAPSTGLESAETSETVAPVVTPNSKVNTSPDKAVEEHKTSENIKPTDTPATEKAEKSKNGYSAQVSTDKAKEIQENVTVKDKANVASIVMGQLSVSDIKRLQELANGGLTIDEKREARSIILGKVSEEQYNELSQVAKKYGVSQGKSRDQVIAEEEKAKEGSE